MLDEGAIVIMIGAIVFLSDLLIAKAIRWHAAGYIAVATAIYILAAAVPSKNLFVGLYFYILLWCFAWRSISTFLTIRQNKVLNQSWLFNAAIISYVVLLVTISFVQLSHWPKQSAYWLIHNRETIQRIASDMNALIGPNDCFVAPTDNYFPASLEYYMNMELKYANDYCILNWDIKEPKNRIESYIQHDIVQAKVILIYDNIDYAQDYIWIPAKSAVFYKDLLRFVQSDDSIYTLANVYTIYAPFAGHQEPASWRMLLFVQNSSQN